MRCESCGAEGGVVELQKKALEVIDDHWAFYICDQLDCGLFYRESHDRFVPVEQPLKRGQLHPIQQASVYVPRLQRRVKIQLVGIGQAGRDRLTELVGDATIFPVNLWRHNRILDPSPSRTVTEDMMREWLDLVEYIQATEEVQQNFLRRKRK